MEKEVIVPIKNWDNYQLQDLIGEIWVHIEGFENYMVSNFSRMKSLGRHVRCKNGKRVIKSRILKQRPISHGYLGVHISNGVYRCTIATHIAVAKAFIPNIDNLPQVAHIDHNRSNPSLSNLMWATGAENMQQSSIAGRMSKGEGRHSSVLKEIEVKAIYETKIPYRSLAKIFGVSFSTIQELKSGKTWKYLTKNIIKNASDKLPKGMGGCR